MKEYKVLPHAIDRAVERLGVKRRDAELHLRQLMQSAQYQGDKYSPANGNGQVYDHHKNRVRIIVTRGNVITTCYKMMDPLAPIEDITQSIALPAELLTELKRKAGAFLRKYIRRNRDYPRSRRQRAGVHNVALPERRRGKEMTSKLAAVMGAVGDGILARANVRVSSRAKAVRVRASDSLRRRR